MPIDLTNKPIAITGASAGIGLATALACARAGMPVALAARREDLLRDAVAKINALFPGGRAIAVVCDVTKPDDCARLIDETVRAFGSIHAVFANAGYGVECKAHEMSDQALREIFECNFYGTLNTIRPALPHFLNQKRGHVLICSSAMSKVTIPLMFAYAATKSAQDHLGRAMRIELESAGVNVSTIHPIGTHTEFSKVLREKGGGKPRSAETSIKFKQTPEQVADAIVACLRRPKGEVWTSLPTRLLIALGTACPPLVDAILRRRYHKRGGS